MPWYRQTANAQTSLHMPLVYLLSTPMGIDYVVIGFDMEVQPLVTHNAA